MLGRAEKRGARQTVEPRAAAGDEIRARATLSKLHSSGCSLHRSWHGAARVKGEGSRVVDLPALVKKVLNLPEGDVGTAVCVDAVEELRGACEGRDGVREGREMHAEGHARASGQLKGQTRGEGAPSVRPGVGVPRPLDGRRRR